MPRPRKLPPEIIHRTDGQGYHARFYFDGRRVRKKLANDAESAIRELARLKRRLRDEGDGTISNDETLKALRADYLKERRQRLKPRTVETYANQLANILGRLPAAAVAHLDPRAIVIYRTIRLDDGVVPATVNNEVNSLIRLFNWGVKQRRIGSNPLAGIIEPLPHDRPKERRDLADDEIERLLTTSPVHWQTVWYALLVTGMRISELIATRFADVDFEGREIIVRAHVAKNHRARRIPLDDHLYELLDELRRGQAKRKPGKSRDAQRSKRHREKFTRELVFITRTSTPHTRRNVYRAFMTWSEHAGIETRRYSDDGHEIDHVDVHALRTTFITNLIAQGADPKTVQYLAGHQSLATTMKFYAKVRSTTTRQAVAQLSYGSGVQNPAGIVELPAEKAGNGHRRATVIKTTEDSRVANVG